MSQTGTRKGSWLNEYRIRKTILRSSMILTSLAGLGLVAAAGWALYRWYYAFSYFGPAAIWNWVQLPLFLGAFGMPLVLLLGIRWMRFAQARVFTHVKGIRILHNQRKIDIPWKEIAEIKTSSTRYGFNGFIWSQKAEIRLFTHGKHRPVRLDSRMAEFETLVDTIKQYVYPPLMKLYSGKLSSRESLAFGPLHISAEGFKSGRKLYAWESVDNILLKSGRLLIHINHRDRKKSLRLPVSRVPNVDVCVEIMKRMSGIQ